MKFRTQQIAYWFFASALLLLVLLIVYGFIMEFAHMGYDNLHEFIPFNTARAVHTPTEAIYLNQKKDIHDVSAVLLLDLSFSTDARVQDARVLDSIMETVYCVGEVIEDSIGSFAVAGFSSNTRRSCRFELLKDFHEPWAEAKLHFGALQPQGYTRIGPALRHAQELLINQSSSRKIIILVTDGQPCDYDRYEGTYGIRDVRKAVETGKLYGLQTHAFAIEKQATENFPMMFSRDHFDVVQSPTQLTQRMSKLFSRLIASWATLRWQNQTEIQDSSPFSVGS